MSFNIRQSNQDKERAVDNSASNPNPRYICGPCVKNYPSRDALVKHRKERHYYCMECPEISTYDRKNKETLYQHYDEMHEGYRPSATNPEHPALSTQPTPAEPASSSRQPLQSGAASSSRRESSSRPVSPAYESDTSSNYHSANSSARKSSSRREYSSRPVSQAYESDTSSRYHSANSSARNSQFYDPNWRQSGS